MIPSQVVKPNARSLTRIEQHLINPHYTRSDARGRFINVQSEVFQMADESVARDKKHKTLGLWT